MGVARGGDGRPFMSSSGGTVQGWGGVKGVLEEGARERERDESALTAGMGRRRPRWGTRERAAEALRARRGAVARPPPASVRNCDAATKRTGRVCVIGAVP